VPGLEEPRVGPVENGRTCRAADPPAHKVADNRSDRKSNKQYPQSSQPAP
jgi:hypothetical protein